MFSAIFAQKTPPPILFGEVSMGDLQMKVYEKDTTASAIILCDYGTYNKYPSHSDDYTRHLRIKIFNKSGFIHVPQKIAYFSPKNSRYVQSVDDFKAATYNFENGIIKTYPFDKKEIFLEKNDNGNNNFSFALPQVKEGSVVEISYTLKSDFAGLPTWNFQYEIPVIWSEIRVTHPRDSNYDVTLQSLIPLTINENEQQKNSLLINYRFAMAHIPALKKEPFITTIEDYRSKLEFEIAATYYGGQLTRNYTLTWTGLNNTLLNSRYFGLQIDEFDKALYIAQSINKETNDTLSRAKKAYDYIQSIMQWNEYESINVRERLNDSFEKHKGGCAEINLMLIKLLTDIGIMANPVVLSTRDNGKLSELISQEKYNYVVAQFNYQGKDILLDATEKEIPFGILPFRCLNERGRLIDKKEGRWVNISPQFGRREVTLVDMTLNKNQRLEGVISISLNGYSAIDIRSLFNAKGKKDFTLEYKKTVGDIEIDSLVTRNLDSLDKSFEIEIKSSIKDAYTELGDLIYFNPMLSMGEDKNPFQSSDRQFPVNLGIAQEAIYFAKIRIPDNYVVESIPKFQTISLPNDGGKFTYGVQTDGNMIKINSKITLKKTLYPQGEYLPLREFYNKVITKQSEQIVLKKKT